MRMGQAERGIGVYIPEGFGKLAVIDAGAKSG